MNTRTILPSDPPTEEEESRLSVRVNRKEMERIQGLLPHGVLSYLVRGLLYALENAITKHGYDIIKAILHGNVEIVIREPLDSKIESTKEPTNESTTP